jgi:hypothetical protein
MHIEQAPDAQQPIGRALAERDQQQVLPDFDFIGGVEKEIGWE